MPKRPTNNLFQIQFEQSGQAIPQLLVSVRSAQEATAALAGGADIIDVKEPAKGPLGAASVETIQEIAKLVSQQSPETPITVALGELTPTSSNSPSASIQANLLTAIANLPSIVAVKVGLARMKDQPWQNELTNLNQQIQSHSQSHSQSHAQSGGGLELVPVAYADSEAANSPTPEQVFATANRLRLRGFLIDTFSKSEDPSQPADGLFQAISQERLSELFETAQLMEVIGAIAGSLKSDQLHLLKPLQPAIIGVRGAVCEGGRGGVVTKSKVLELATKIKQTFCSSN